MPFMQAVVARANTALNSTNIATTAAAAQALLAPGNSLFAAAKTLIGLSPAEEAHFSLWPSSVQKSLQAALYDAVTRDPPVPVQLLWTPAAGFGVSIWEAAGVNGSFTAISVHLQSPLPAAVTA